MSEPGQSTGDTERVEGEALEAEAHALEDIFNTAKTDYSPQLEWFAMRYDAETDTQYFYLEVEEYLDNDGIEALREFGRDIHYIEANGLGDEQIVGIEITVEGSVPTRSGTERYRAFSEVFNNWAVKADQNVEEWGVQAERTLLLAMQEELGELTQAVLEADSEGGDESRIHDELEDLGALLVQFYEARNVRSIAPETDRSDGGDSE
jgi:hypothetical protein